MEVPRLSEEELLQARSGETSAAIRVRVCRARELQACRFSAPPPPSTDPADHENMPPHPPDQMAAIVPRPKGSRLLFCNARMGPKEIRAYCAPSPEVNRYVF